MLCNHWTAKGRRCEAEIPEPLTADMTCPDCGFEWKVEDPAPKAQFHHNPAPETQHYPGRDRDTDAMPTAAGRPNQAQTELPARGGSSGPRGSDPRVKG